MQLVLFRLSRQVLSVLDRASDQKADRRLSFGSGMSCLRDSGAGGGDRASAVGYWKWAQGCRW